MRKMFSKNQIKEIVNEGIESGEINKPFLYYEFVVESNNNAFTISSTNSKGLYNLLNELVVSQNAIINKPIFISIYDSTLEKTFAGFPIITNAYEDLCLLYLQYDGDGDYLSLQVGYGDEEISGSLGTM